MPMGLTIRDMRRTLGSGQTDSDMTHNHWTLDLKARWIDDEHRLTRYVPTHIGGTPLICMYIYLSEEIRLDTGCSPNTS